MKQINIFINFAFLFIIILFIVTVTYIVSNDYMLKFLISSDMHFQDILFALLYKLLYTHSDFVIFSFGLTILLFYGFTPVNLFKARHYKIFILIVPVIMATALFYFENFYFERDPYIKKAMQMEKSALKKLDYRKLLKNKIEKLNGLVLMIEEKDKNYASGYALYKNQIISSLFSFLRMAETQKQLNFKQNREPLFSDIVLHIKTGSKTINIDFSNQENNLWQRIKYNPNRLFPYAFLVFILLPLALLFNNQNWYLRTLIFLIIAVPLYLYSFKYFNKLILSIKLNIKSPLEFIEPNEILLIVAYIIIGNFLFKIADSARRLKTRIEIEKVKRINR